MSNVRERAVSSQGKPKYLQTLEKQIAEVMGGMTEAIRLLRLGHDDHEARIAALEGNDDASGASDEPDGEQHPRRDEDPV